MACDAACRWMRGTLRVQVRARSFRTVRLGFLTTSRAPQNTPRVPLKGTRGVLHRAILTEKCHLNTTQHPPTTRYAPGARSQATGSLGKPNTPQNELFSPILTPCLGPLAYGRYAPSRVNYPFLRARPWGRFVFPVLTPGALTSLQVYSPKFSSRRALS